MPGSERSGQRVSTLFGSTLRQAPAVAEGEAHALLLRAGYLRAAGAAGGVALLPLGWRTLRKLQRIVRDELERVGGQELSLPVTERPEEALAFHAAAEISSYRQLPALVYQVRTSFRDEPRPRRGLLRRRQVRAADSCSLDRDQAGLERQYQAHHEAYLRIGRSAGVPLTAVRSRGGAPGGAATAHRVMYLTPAGDEQVARCAHCGYAAAREAAAFALEPAAEEPAPLEEVPTPGAATIDELAACLQVAPQRTAKMVFYATATAAAPPAAAPAAVVAAVVRGDLEVNPAQVRDLAGVAELRPAHEDEIAAAGMTPGFASPVGVAPGAAIFVVDRWVAQSANLVMGANRTGYHLRNVCCGRDYQPTVVGQVAAVFDGAPCAACGRPLRLAPGVEVGALRQLETGRAAAPGAPAARFTDAAGAAHPILMGFYRIGLERLLACVAEAHHDAHGLALPVSVAPYQVALVALARKPETWQAAEQVFAELTAAGIEVLYDDRRELSAGVKLTDADLRGLPLRLVVGERALAQGGAELSRRGETARRIVPLPQLRAALQDPKILLRPRRQPPTVGPRAGPPRQTMNL